MKFLIILLTVLYINNSNSKPFPSISVLSIPQGFNISNVHNFKGFNATHFDGKELNPFQFDINDVVARYKAKHNRSYSANEQNLRKENLRKSLAAIAQHILDSASRPTTFNVGLNSLSDKSEEEFRALLGTRAPVSNHTIGKRSTIRDTTCQTKTITTIPTSFDWRTQNIVTPVKDQQQCGSCWAFASTATIESLWAKKTSQMIELSEEDLLNCAVTNGCNGATMDAAFIFVKNNGEAQEAAAPYTATVTQCEHYPLINGVKIDNYCGKTDVTSNTDANIQRDIMENGPVMAAICADYLQGYTSGVLNVTNCPTAINHAIAIVGWGSQNGINYWIVKNSWGTGWGENGYFRIIRGKNMCGINRYYYYPLMTNAVPFSKTN